MKLAFSKFVKSRKNLKIALCKQTLEGKYRLKNLSGAIIDILQLYINLSTNVGVQITTTEANLTCRFVEELLKATNTAIERVKLKMASITSQIRKVRMQLEQRKALGEALRAIDFEQLSIENQDCMRKIEEKNRHLLRMKKIAGKK